MHLDYPFAGSRMLRELLRGEGIAVGRELVVAMMRRRRIEALYRWPNAPKPADGHKIYPYLLRGLAVERPNEVWAMDITYIPMPVALSIWRRWWTGSAGGFLRGGCRSPWRLRPPAATRGRMNAPPRLAWRPNNGNATISTGRGSTYRGRNTASTKPATSIQG